MMNAITTLAEATPGIPDLSPLVTALTSAITPAQLITVLVSVIGAGMSFVLLWFGIRKLIKIFSSAVFRGKLTA